MSALVELWHIMKKDARYTRWLLIGYALLVIAATAGAVSAEELADGRLQWAGGLLLVMGPITAAILIQADSPTRPDAFWASHPFRRSGMLGAKLVMVIGFLLVLPLLGQLFGLIAFGIPASEQWSIMALSAIIYGLVLLITILLAALTWDLKSFVLGVLALLIAALVIAVIGTNVEWAWWRQSALQGAAVILGLLGVGTLFILLYLRRGLRRARAAGGAALALLLLGSLSPTMMNPSLVAEKDAGPLPAGKVGITIELRDTAEIAPDGRFGIRLLLTGADSGQRFRLDRSRARFFLRDGTTLEMPLWDFGPTTLQIGRLVLPGVPSVQGNNAFSGPFTTMGQQVSGEQRSALMRGIDSVRVTVVLTRLEPTIFTLLPLREGAGAVRDGQSVTLTTLKLGAFDDLMELDTRTVGSASGQAGWMNPTTGLSAFLVNEQRGEGVFLPHSATNSSPGLLVLPGASVHQGWIRYQAPHSRSGDRYETDAGWLDGAKLMLLRWVDGPSYQVSATSVPLPPDAKRGRGDAPLMSNDPSGGVTIIR